MLLIQEHSANQTDFTAFLSASNLLIMKKLENDYFGELKMPVPPISGLDKQQIQVIKKENRNITWIELSKDSQYIAVTTENKQLVVFDKMFQIIKNIVLTRVSSKVCFSPTNDILVADRTGDVYLYKLLDEKDEPTLLLGHLSVILDMLVTDCGKYIITCDRDEKIRVSHYPNTYNIATYCLGHTEFVTTLKMLKSNILLSASGDGTIRMWNYLEGKQVNAIYTKELVDEDVIQNFTKQMDVEKVDVTVLPINNIQIHEDKTNIILSVSLYNVGKLYLYSINPKSLDYVQLGSVDVGTTAFSYCLCTKLYILSDKLKVYELIDNKVKALHYKDLEQNLLEYKDIIMNDNSDITLLYKRKFDNLQDYMERKKLRLETK